MLLKPSAVQFKRGVWRRRVEGHQYLLKQQYNYFKQGFCSECKRTLQKVTP